MPFMTSLGRKAPLYYIDALFNIAKREDAAAITQIHRSS